MVLVANDLMEPDGTLLQRVLPESGDILLYSMDETPVMRMRFDAITGKMVQVPW